MKEDTKRALGELFTAYETATEQQKAARTAAASQAAVYEVERENALENVLRPTLEEMAAEIRKEGHGAEIAVNEGGEIEFRFTPKHSMGLKLSTSALPKVEFVYSSKDRTIVFHPSGNGVAERRDGPRVLPRELTREKVEASILDLLRQVLPRGTHS